MGVSISIEGPEGAGKTILSMLTSELFKQTTGFPVRSTREPGGTPVGEAIRGILKNSEYSDIDPMTNVLLFNAARSELFHKVEEPFLKDNLHGILLKDRSWLSTIALQDAEGADIKYINFVQEPFISIPDRFVIIDIPVEETIVRMTAAQNGNASREVDWRDQHTIETLERIRENYLSFAVKHKERCIVLDCFNDPWDKAARIEVEAVKILREREGIILDGQEIKNFQQEFSLEAKNIALTHKTWDSRNKQEVLLFDIRELREEVENARIQLGYPSREELQKKMHEKWQFIGLEGFSVGRERR